MRQIKNCAVPYSDAELALELNFERNNPLLGAMSVLWNIPIKEASVAWHHPLFNDEVYSLCNLSLHRGSFGRCIASSMSIIFHRETLLT
jgi:hypothetical protein